MWAQNNQPGLVRIIDAKSLVAEIGNQTLLRPLPVHTINPPAENRRFRCYQRFERYVALNCALVDNSPTLHHLSEMPVNPVCRRHGCAERVRRLKVEVWIRAQATVGKNTVLL